MEIIVNYSEVSKQHPDIVDKWVKDAKVHKSPIDHEKLQWSYSFGVKIEGMRGDVLMKKIHSGELFTEKKEEKTPEQIAAESLETVVGLSLRVIATGFKREKAINDIPELFSAKYKALIIEGEQKKFEERERFERLTPAERNREEQELINELFHMGGFFGSNVGPNGTTPIVPKPVQYDINDILDKISGVGIEGLTAGEKKFLDDNSKK